MLPSQPACTRCPGTSTVGGSFPLHHVPAAHPGDQEGFPPPVLLHPPPAASPRVPAPWDRFSAAPSAPCLLKITAGGEETSRSHRGRETEPAPPIPNPSVGSPSTSWAERAVTPLRHPCTPPHQCHRHPAHPCSPSQRAQGPPHPPRRALPWRAGCSGRGQRGPRQHHLPPARLGLRIAGAALVPSATQRHPTGKGEGDPPPRALPAPLPGHVLL